MCCCLGRYWIGLMYLARSLRRFPVSTLRGLRRTSSFFIVNFREGIVIALVVVSK
jgi:hypothetical protein